MKKPIIIGITGGSASGKTLFLNSLLSHFSKEQICLISQDNYYKKIDEIPRDEKNYSNFDVPEAIDFELFALHISKLIKGEVVEIEEYTFEQSTDHANTLKFNPAPIIVVEGIFVFQESSIYNLLDLKVFVDAHEHVKIRRRIVRDMNERNYSLETILYRWENHVAPTFAKYIKPTKEKADIIINNNRNFDMGLNVMAAFIKDSLGA